MWFSIALLQEFGALLNTLRAERDALSDATYFSVADKAHHIWLKLSKPLAHAGVTSTLLLSIPGCASAAASTSSPSASAASINIAVPTAATMDADAPLVPVAPVSMPESLASRSSADDDLHTAVVASTDASSAAAAATSEPTTTLTTTTDTATTASAVASTRATRASFADQQYDAATQKLILQHHRESQELIEKIQHHQMIIKNLQNEAIQISMGNQLPAEILENVKSTEQAVDHVVKYLRTKSQLCHKVFEELRAFDMEAIKNWDIRAAEYLDQSYPLLSTAQTLFLQALQQPEQALQQQRTRQQSVGAQSSPGQSHRPISMAGNTSTAPAPSDAAAL